MSMKMFPAADQPRRKTSAYVPFHSRQKRWTWIRTKEHHLKTDDHEGQRENKRMKEETSETDVKDGIVRAYDLAYLLS